MILPFIDFARNLKTLMIVQHFSCCFCGFSYLKLRFSAGVGSGLPHKGHYAISGVNSGCRAQGVFATVSHV